MSTLRPQDGAPERALPGLILVAAGAVAIAYAYPGYLNWDSADQLLAARDGTLEDWHPPLMAVYWRWLDAVVPGPLGMLLLQLALFLGGTYALLRQRFAPLLSASLAAGLLLFPPLLAPMSAVWKDAQMAGFLVAGFALALQPRWWMRALGGVLLVLACGVRDNGAAALPPLCLLIVGSTQLLRRRIALVGVALALFAGLAFTANRLDRAVTDHRAYAWYRSVAIHDLAGTICHEDPMTDAEVRALLAGVELHESTGLQSYVCRGYNPRVWFDLTYTEQGPGVFSVPPAKAERIARRAAWWRAVREHPTAYLAHRWDVMKHVLGLTPDPLWEPICQTSANTATLDKLGVHPYPSPMQAKVGALFNRLAGTLLFRPWVYLALGLVILGYAARARDRWLAALVGSGLLYELSFFIGTAAPDYRYSHWMITCVSLALVTIFTERLRAGLRARTHAPV